jgi:hypothetical protein
MYDSACEMVNGISAVKKRWKALGAEPPSCAVEPPVAASTPPVTVNVTNDSKPVVDAVDRLAERMDRQAIAGAGK